MSYTDAEFGRVIKQLTTQDAEIAMLRRKVFVARRVIERYAYEYGDPRVCRECKAKMGDPHREDCGVGIVETTEIDKEQTAANPQYFPDTKEFRFCCPDCFTSVIISDLDLYMKKYKGLTESTLIQECPKCKKTLHLNISKTLRCIRG